MTTDREARVRKTTNLHAAMEANNTLKKVEADFADNPQSMQYFYDLFRKSYSGATIMPTDKPIVGTMCVQVPDELIYAAGAVPMRLCCGAGAFDQAGAEFMPSKSCPVVKSTMGLLHVHRSRYQKMLSAIVVPATCDLKRKAAENLSRAGYKVIMLEMPSTRESSMARHYWQNSVTNLAIALQERTGVKITAKRLRSSIDKVSRASRAFRELYGFRKLSPALIAGKDVFLVNNAYFFDDIESWIDAVDELNRELERKKEQGLSAGNRHAPRILFTGSPPIFPNLKVPLLVEQSGGIIVADEVCSSSRLLYDSVAYDEPRLYDMMPAIADRSLKACTCPCLTPNTNRERKIIEMAEGFEIDGVVYQAFSGCMPYEMEQKQICDMLEKSNIHMLYVETDYSPEDSGQLSTRVEAFLESIKARKRSGK